MSGGVRNLRAMFENKEESSIPPPDRGRSPAGSIGGGSNGTSPRPLSKVRTSFVAVERSGQLGSQWGLRKESTTDPSLATRRASFSIDEETDPKAIADRKQSINSEFSARQSNTAVTETIPESAIETPPVDSVKKLGYFNGNNGWGKTIPPESKSTANPDKKPSVEESSTKLFPGNTVSSAVASDSAALKNGGGFGESLNGNANRKVKPSSPTKDATKTAPADRIAKPMPISTTSSSATTKAALRSTKLPKTPTTPVRPSSTPGTSGKDPTSKPATSSVTTAQTRPADMKSAATSTISKPAARPTTSSTVASTSENKPPITSPSTGFHKPKPKSPTRPAKLPASMTAPTASSLSKVATVTVPSRQSLGPSTKTISRSPSHASLSQKQELRRKPSKLDGDRPALGRPSTSTLKKQPSRPSLPKQTAPADAGFLARMMRPTTSSAGKTTERIITPPRANTTTRPTTREGPAASHKPHHEAKGSPSIINLPSAAKDTQKEDSKPAHSGEVEGPSTSINGMSQSEPPPGGKDESKLSNTKGNGLAAASSDENEKIEEVTMEKGTTLTVGLATVAEDTVGANRNGEQQIISEEPKLAGEAPQPIHIEHGAPEPVIIEESTSTVPGPDKAALSSKEPVISDEPKITVPAVDEADSSEDYATTNGVFEPSQEELKTEVTGKSA